MAKPTALRGGVAACLVFSGLSALVYQIVWVRLLGFTFGTTTEAVSTVLAVFFAGLALGNLLAAAALRRVRRPLRVYALLELGIGLYALLSVPLLASLDDVHALVGVGLSPAALAAVRVAGSALVLLPPTLAMGATLPVVARALVTEDKSLGRWSAILYAANTLGAVLGAYLCGFWLIPGLGLRRTVWLAALANFAVGAAVLALVRGAGAAETPTTPGAPAAPAPAERARRAAFLAFFGASGFVAIGYEIVWSKVFGIVMEGTLYGFAAVLAGFLLGIAIGSYAISSRVDRIRDLPRCFGLLHAGTAVAVAVGVWAVPDLPFHLQRISELGLGDPLHRLLVLVLPILIVPTALFGAAFPVLIRIYTRHAEATGRGIGVATAVNTVGSILASLVVGFWWIPAFGMDRSLLVLLLLDGSVALAAIAAFQAARGWRAFANVGGCAAALCGAFACFDGVQVDQAIAGLPLHASTLGEYRQLRDRDLAWQRFRAEGRAAIVTVYELPTYRLLRTNGLPEAGYGYLPPYYPSDVMLLGVLPYLAAEGEPTRALLVGLGGSNTLDALEQTQLEPTRSRLR
jgi:spermidine synthase